MQEEKTVRSRRRRKEGAESNSKGPILPQKRQKPKELRAEQDA